MADVVQRPGRGNLKRICVLPFPSRFSVAAAGNIQFRAARSSRRARQWSASEGYPTAAARVHRERDPFDPSARQVTLCHSSIPRSPLRIASRPALAATMARVSSSSSRPRRRQLLAILLSAKATSRSRDTARASPSPMQNCPVARAALGYLGQQHRGSLTGPSRH